MEKKFNKEMDLCQTELETLKGEFKVRQMKLKLQEMKLDTALAEVEEKQEESALAFKDKLDELKKLQTQQVKDKKLLATLIEKKRGLQETVKMLTKQIEGGSDGDDGENSAASQDYMDNAMENDKINIDGQRV